MTSSTARAYHLRADEGRAIWHQGSLVTLKATSEDTDGQLWAAVQLAGCGWASPRQIHAHQEQAWYVIEGQVVFAIGEERVCAAAGSFVFAPRGTPRTLRVESDTARYLELGLPAGFERFFIETGGAARSLTLPVSSRQPPRPDHHAVELRGYGVDVMGPPLEPRAGWDTGRERSRGRPPPLPALPTSMTAHPLAFPTTNEEET